VHRLDRQYWFNLDYSLGIPTEIRCRQVTPFRHYDGGVPEFPPGVLGCRILLNQSQFEDWKPSAAAELKPKRKGSRWADKRDIEGPAVFQSDGGVPIRRETNKRPGWYPMLRTLMENEDRRILDLAERKPDVLPPQFPKSTRFRDMLIAQGVPEAKLAKSVVRYHAANIKAELGR
jgi:hypothetical protein